MLRVRCAQRCMIWLISGLEDILLALGGDAPGQSVPVESCDAVHYEQRKACICHHGGGSHQQLRLVVCVVRPGVGDVVQHI